MFFQPDARLHESGIFGSAPLCQAFGFAAFLGFDSLSLSAIAIAIATAISSSFSSGIGIP
jgi:hypothetical protein